MINLAGNEDCDEIALAELKASEIPALSVYRSAGEVPTYVAGYLHGWVLLRAWRYWVARCEAGLPFEVVEQLYEKAGDVVRLDGHCVPADWWKFRAARREPATLYHIDTVGGLEAFAAAVREQAEMEARER